MKQSDKRRYRIGIAGGEGQLTPIRSQAEVDAESARKRMEAAASMMSGEQGKHGFNATFIGPDGTVMVGGLAQKRPKAKLGREFCAMFTGKVDMQTGEVDPKLGLPFVALVELLTHRELLVFGHLVAFLPYGDGFVPVDTKLIAEMSGLAQSAVSNAITKMTQVGILMKSEVKNGRLTQYRVNPWILWKGQAKDFNKLDNDGKVKALKLPPRKRGKKGDGAAEAVAA